MVDPADLPCRLTLGTAQLGMPYGIANRTGQPDIDQARRLIRRALDGGIRCFDTAAAYGCSEQLLGQLLGQLGVRDSVMVVTKVMPLADDQRTSDVAAAAIQHSVASSRRRLGIDRLPLVMMHRDADWDHVEALVRLQRRGWIDRLGVSTADDPTIANSLLDDPLLAAMQLPANLLDQRHRLAGVLARAARRGVTVFVRSIYLQGLLLMPEAEIPRPLAAVIKVRQQLQSLAAEAGMTLGELAIRYMLAQPGVNSLVVGAETVAQLNQNLRLIEQGAAPPDVVAAVESLPTELPRMVLTPALWPQDVGSR